MDEETTTTENDLEVTEPIIIDLGKQKAKRIKKMLKGRGKLWFEVEDVIAEVNEMLAEELEGKTIIPLIIVYEKKPKQKRLGGMFGL
jgi:hypothetical protein